MLLVFTTYENEYTRALLETRLSSASELGFAIFLLE